MSKPFKFLLFSFVLFGFFTSVNSASANESTFPDVPAVDQNYIAIEYLANEGIFKGYPDGSFRLGQPITRVELVTIMVRNEGVSPDPNIYNNCFTDVHAEWFAANVCYAKGQGWIQGYEDGTFRPANGVDEAEAVKIILEPLFGEEIRTLTPEQVNYNLRNSERYITEWAPPYIGFAYSKILMGHPYDKLAPRAEVAEILFRSKLVKEQNWIAYAPYLRNSLFHKKGLGHLLVKAPFCSFWHVENDLLFLDNYLKDKYGLERPYRSTSAFKKEGPNIFPFLSQGKVCTPSDGSLFFSFNIQLAEEDFVSHFLHFGPTGELLKDESIRCPDASPLHPLIDENLEDLPTFKPIHCEYSQMGNGIYGYNLLAEADPATFIPLENSYSRDAQHVYFLSDRLYVGSSRAPVGYANVDVSTFEVIQNSSANINNKWGEVRKYAKDKNHVYFRGQLIDGLDPATFELLPYPYLKDAQHVYYEHHGISVVDGADPNTFEYLQDPYFKDATSFYYGNERLELMNPKTSQVLSSVYSRDDQDVYCRNQRLDLADAKTFEVLDWPAEEVKYIGSIAKDAQYVYWEEKVIQGADPDTFELLKAPYTKDAKNVYYEGQWMEDADPTTFEILEEGYTKDAMNLYKQGQLQEILSKQKMSFHTPSFQILDQNFIQDQQGIYYSHYSNSTGKYFMPELDPATFQVLKHRYSGYPTDFSKDKDSLHYENNTLAFEELDLATVEVVERTLLRDAKNYFCRVNDEIPGKTVCGYDLF